MAVFRFATVSLGRAFTRLSKEFSNRDLKRLVYWALSRNGAPCA